MTVKYLDAKRIIGLAADSKPLDVPVASVYIESDTPSQFILIGVTWTALP